MAKLKKPFAPGRYPLVVVGSGPGGIQTSYFLKRLRVRHAFITSDEAPGGMFRRFPFFERLISWSKPYAPAERGTGAYERYDWNSLLADDPRHRALVPKFMDGTSYFPSREEMEQGMAAFVHRTRMRIRYGCRWEATRLAGEEFVLATSEGEYRTPIVVFAIGVTAPWAPEIKGLEHVYHYVDLREPRRYAGRRVLILGKRNSAFETANGLLPWAKQILMISPSPVRFSVDARHPSAARAVYMQPYEDHVLAGGNYVLDGVPQRIQRTSRGLRVHAEGTTTPGKMIFDVDEVIAATGFQTPLLDLPSLGVATFGQSRLPGQTPFFESNSVPRLYFAGSTSAGATGLSKYGRPSSSGVVHGFRQNARVLAEHIATSHFDIELPRRKIPAARVAPFLLNEASEGAELWNQQAYLARVVTFDPKRGILNEGIQPLAHFVDAAGPKAIAMTVETDPDGDIRPAAYTRRGGKVQEHILSHALLHDFRTKENRAVLESLVKKLAR